MTALQAKLSGNLRLNNNNLRLASLLALSFLLAPLAIAQSGSQTGSQTGTQPISSAAAHVAGAPQVAAGAPQAATGAPLEGTVVDIKGGLIGRAIVTVRNDAGGKSRTVTSDAVGHFSISGLPIGSYTVEINAPGFASNIRKGVQVAATPAEPVSFTLAIGSATSDVTVEADATGSIAASLATMDAPLTETSARTEITSSMIQNFMSPVADFGEAVEMAPGTFTTNGNGVGLGQSKTYFRGFADGDYDIDFDGIPFFDTNTPTHHSWAFFPAQFLGGIDFDRSPGTANTIGPTPFGGSIHLLSKEMSPLDNVRVEVSGGSFHTYLYDGEYDSGNFGPGKKFNLNMDVHHLQSDGYQTNNTQTRNAGDLKFQYKLSDKTILTGFSGVIWLDANTPNFNATRCQMYGQPTDGSYTCVAKGSTTGFLPYTGAGINFLNANNSDPLLYLDAQYNYYHVPTDFEYVDLHKDLPHHIVLDFKPYTYDYDNSEKYTNAVPITDDMALLNTTYGPLGVKITTLCDQQATKKGVTAEPCGVDKYNSYRKYGETSELDQFSKFGILRAGMWYEWARTNRHQYPSDPLNNWADQALPNFAEKFVSDSYQPFAEYEFHITPKLFITPGVKFAYYTIGTQQFLDDGKTIGCLHALPCTGANANPAAFIANGGSYFATLPSGVANYRIKNPWSVYVQFAQGTIVPPSSVFDYTQGTTGGSVPVATFPKQQKNTTYQAGTVFKLKHVTFDGDFYYIRFQSGYSDVLSTSNGEPTFYLQPSSTSRGVEGESTIALFRGLSAYLNATYGNAYYRGQIGATPVTGSPANTPTLVVTTPANQYVQDTPSDTETEGLTYQHKGFDFGVFNKRVGTFYLDNTSYHNQATINPFTLTNLFFNYTVRSSGRFDQTKLRISFNNLFNEHNITGDGIVGTPPTTTLTQTVNGTPYTYTNPFISGQQTPINGGDTLSVLPGRSIMFAVTFGFNPHRH